MLGLATHRAGGQLGHDSGRQQELEQAIVEAPAAAHFFAMLEESSRPLIYAGGGVINGNAGAALTEFATAFGVPVVTTLMGIGSLDTTHPLSMRMLGMHGAAFANYAVEDCDFLMAVGARFDDRVAGNPPKFASRAKFIAHLDIDASEINKNKAAHIAINSDVRSFLTAINPLVEPGDWREGRSDRRRRAHRSGIHRSHRRASGRIGRD